MTTYSAWSVLFFALLLTVLYFLMLDGNYLHFYPGYFNDQIGYIGASRHFADHGRFIWPGHFEGTGTAIIPKLLPSSHSRLYVPGPMLFQALIFKLFGVSIFTAKLHNLFSYIASSVLVFLIGTKIYNPKVGFWSAIIFLLLPVNVLYTMTALAEMSIVFAALLAFYIFISIPNRWRIYSMIPLVLFAYLFRQTTLFMILPMLAYWYDNRENQPIWLGMLCAFLTVATCFTASVIDVHMGRASLTLLDNLIHGHMNYGDAFPESHQSVSIKKLAGILIEHFYKQIKYVFHGLTRPRWNNKLIDIFSGYTMILFTTITIMGGWRHKKQRIFELGCASLMLALLGVCLTLYSGILYILVKTTFYCTAFILIPTVAFIFSDDQNRFTQFVFNTRQFFFAVLLFLSFGTLGLTAHNAQLAKHIQEDCNRFVESIKPVPNMLVSTTPYLYTLYNIRHYPQLTAFIPANKKTLVLLNERYPIGTIIIPVDDLKTKISKADIESIGLVFTTKKRFKDTDYLVFKNPQKESA